MGTSMQSADSKEIAVAAFVIGEVVVDIENVCDAVVEVDSVLTAAEVSEISAGSDCSFGTSSIKFSVEAFVLLTEQLHIDKEQISKNIGNNLQTKRFKYITP